MRTKKTAVYGKRTVGRTRNADGVVRAAGIDSRRAAKVAELDSLYGGMTIEHSFAIAKRAGILTAGGKLAKRFR